MYFTASAAPKPNMTTAFSSCRFQEEPRKFWYRLLYRLGRNFRKWNTPGGAKHCDRTTMATE